MLPGRNSVYQVTPTMLCIVLFCTQILSHGQQQTPPRARVLIIKK